MRITSVLLVALCGISCAHAGLFDGLFGGGGNQPVPAGGSDCSWKKKDRGMIGGAVDTVGGALGGLVGGVWGALVPTGANKGAIEAAGGGNTGKGGGLFDGVTGLAGGGIGGIWGAVVPNSVRCGSIEGAKSTGNIGTTNRKDPSCDDYHWVDENGNECTPSDEDHANDGHTDDNIETLTHTITLNYKKKADGEKLINSILARWKVILAKYGVSSKDVTIIIYDDQVSGSVHTVTYSIKFKKPSRKYNIDTITMEFENDLKKKPIVGVTITVTGSQSDGGDDSHGDGSSDDHSGDSGSVDQVDTTEHVTTIGGEEISTPVITQTGSKFSVTGTLTMVYQSDSQRESALNKILTIWVAVLKQYQVSRATITVTSVHRTDSSTPTEIFYTVTGTAIKHIDFSAAQQTFLTRAKATNF